MNETENKTGEKEQQKKSSKKGCFIVFLVSAIVMICGFSFFMFLIIALLFSPGLLLSNTIGSNAPLKQTHISGRKESPNKIAVISIDGVILDNDSSWGNTVKMKTIRSQLKEAIQNEEIKAVLLYINSPGGEITATDIIHHHIKKLKQKKPVVALLGTIAASGGYYTAAAADYIIANRLTITGSIGVIINNYNYYNLLKKIGVQDEVYKSREMKDILNPARPRTKSEKIIIQSLINESYDEFVKVVSDGRSDKNKKLTVDYIKNSDIGDGRIFSGSQALKLGLIDQLGYFDDALNKTVSLAHLKKNDYQVISFHKQVSFSEILQKFAAQASTITVKIPAIAQLNMLDPGKLYYLYKEI